LAIVNAQAAKGLYPPKSPKQRQLASELQASTKKAKAAHDQVELAEVIAQQTQTQPASAYSWAIGRNQQDIQNAKDSLDRASGLHEQALLEEQAIGQQLTALQRRPRPSMPAFRCEDYDSDTIICDDGSLKRRPMPPRR
jgi:hypothetical protein